MTREVSSPDEQPMSRVDSHAAPYEPGGSYVSPDTETPLLERLRASMAAFRADLQQASRELCLSESQSAALEMLLDGSNEDVIVEVLVTHRYERSREGAECALAQASRRLARRRPRIWSALRDWRRQLLWCVRNRSGELPDAERVIIEPAADHSQAHPTLICPGMLSEGREPSAAVRCYVAHERPSLERLAPALTT